MRVPRSACAAYCVAGGVALVVYLAAQAPQTPADQPTFRTSTTLVPLDVRVLDKQGKPITDLTQADFTLVEARAAGVPVSLSVPVRAPADTLKLVVYDYSSDLTGSLNVTVAK